MLRSASLFYYNSSSLRNNVFKTISYKAILPKIRLPVRVITARTFTTNKPTHYSSGWRSFACGGVLVGLGANLWLNIHNNVDCSPEDFNISHRDIFTSTNASAAHFQRPLTTSPENLPKDEYEENIISDLVDNFFKSFRISEISFGAITGFCSGLAVKKTSKFIAFWLGVGFIFFQTLAHFGYLQVSWLKVSKDALRLIERKADLPNGAHESHSASQITMSLFRQLIRLLTASLPSTTGFVGGFAIGFRYG